MIEHPGLKAYGKINLGLDILQKRDDDYHGIQMIVQTVDLYDRIDIIYQDEPGVKVKTSLYYLPNNKNDLVYRTAGLLLKESQALHGVHVKLGKLILITVGMAGDSSDVATVLSGVNKMFRLNPTTGGLMEWDVRIGAGVPYCAMHGTALAERIGGVLTPLPPMPQCQVLITKSGTNVSTRLVYGNLHVNGLRLGQYPDIDGMMETIKDQDVQSLAPRLDNVLEAVTIREYPVIEEIKDVMKEYGATGTITSGSGLTVFDLFTNPRAAQETHEVLHYGQYRHLTKQVYLTSFYNSKA